MLDAVWLKSFATVAQSLSFTEAAVCLGIRQSTVSEHVRKLEAVCGKRLFARDTHSVAITPDGEAMLGFAKAIIETNERALRHFAEDDVRGHVRLGVSEDVVLGGLPNVLKEFVRAHPLAELELTVGLSETLRAKLDAGTLDLVLLKRLTGDSRGTLVWRDPLIWAASTDFRLVTGKPLPLVLLSPPALTRSIALEALEKHGCHWRIICSSDSQSGVHAALLAGLGIAPHAKSLIPAGLSILRDRNLPPLGTTEFTMIARKGARGTSLTALKSMLLKSHALRFID
jgi:DNA-binding transcriptional LysR family regulator